MVLVSVIIPVFNGEKFIQQTLESVLSQTISDLEAIVVNDGSTDRTCEIVNQIGDSRIRLLSFPNGGSSASRNRGILHAQGEYISFMDADDLWHPQKIEAQIEQLKLHPQASVAYSWTDFINEQGRPVHSGGRHSHCGYVYQELLTSNFIESGSNILLRRSILDESHHFDETLKASEDWDFALKLAREHQFALSPSAHIFYRQTANSRSTDFLREERESMKILKRELQTSPDCRMLQRISISNLYFYLATKALKTPLSRPKSLHAIRFISRACHSNPQLAVRRRKVLTIMLGKALVGLLEPQAHQSLRRFLGKLS